MRRAAMNLPSVVCLTQHGELRGHIKLIPCPARVMWNRTVFGAQRCWDTWCDGSDCKCLVDTEELMSEDVAKVKED